MYIITRKAHFELRKTNHEDNKICNAIKNQILCFKQNNRFLPSKISLKFKVSSSKFNEPCLKP